MVGLGTLRGYVRSVHNVYGWAMFWLAFAGVGGGRRGGKS